MVASSIVLSEVDAIDFGHCFLELFQHVISHSQNRVAILVTALKNVDE